MLRSGDFCGDDDGQTDKPITPAHARRVKMKTLEEYGDEAIQPQGA